VARNGVKYSLSEIEEILGEFGAVVNESGVNDVKGVRNLLRKYVRHYEGE
jgi:hypothetical protein